MTASLRLFPWRSELLRVQLLKTNSFRSRCHKTSLDIRIHRYFQRRLNSYEFSYPELGKAIAQGVSPCQRGPL